MRQASCRYRLASEFVSCEQHTPGSACQVLRQLDICEQHMRWMGSLEPNEGSHRNDGVNKRPLQDTRSTSIQTQNESPLSNTRAHSKQTMNTRALPNSRPSAGSLYLKPTPKIPEAPADKPKIKTQSQSTDPPANKLVTIGTAIARATLVSSTVHVMGWLYI